MAFSSTCVLFLLSMVSMEASSSAQVLTTEESKPFVYTKVALPMTKTSTTLDSITTEPKQGGSHHYEEPPCTFAEEIPIRIMGVPGTFCAPPCDPDSDACTSDVPEGVTGVRVCVFVLHPTRVSLSVKDMEGVLSLSDQRLFVPRSRGWCTFVAHYSFPFVSCKLRMAKSIVPLSTVLKKKTMPPCEPLLVRVVRADPWPVNPIRINPALAFVPTPRDTLVWSKP